MAARGGAVADQATLAAVGGVVRGFGEREGRESVVGEKGRWEWGPGPECVTWRALKDKGTDRGLDRGLERGLDRA